jgi:hypothetical protein
MASKCNRLLLIVVVSALLFSFAFSAQAGGLALANPLQPPLIRVDSPQNNKVYPSNDVLLNFTILPDTEITLTSFTYTLDGQESKATNGSTMLTALPSGSHKLTIYGTGHYSYSGSDQTYPYDSVDVIYFSIVYSTVWVTFTITVAAVVSVSLLTVFMLRRRLISVFRGKKTAKFWLGLASFLFAVFLFFIPTVWLTASDYLFPHFNRGLTFTASPIGAVSLGLFFTGIGLYLMWMGNRKKQTPDETD